MLNQKEVLESISSIDIFKSLSSDNLKILFDHASSITLNPADELFACGSDTSSLYYIVSGEIIIHYNRKIIARFGAGEYFGEISLVDNGPRSAAAKAGSETLLIEFSSQVCRDLFSDEAEVWEGISKTLCKRLRDTNAKNAEQYAQFNMNIHDMNNFLFMLDSADIIAGKLPDDDNDISQYLSYIITAKESLKDMMKLTLDAMKDNSLNSKISFDEKEVNIILLINKCVAGLKEHKDIKRMQCVNVNGNNKIDTICCNSLNIKRVISNLIINAAQASDDGSKIDVSVTESEGKIIIEVSDEGSGMSNETMNHLFEQFYTTKSDGCGLGLASCKEIIEAHGGTLTCTSTLGAGSAFICALPVNTAHPK